VFACPDVLREYESTFYSKRTDSVVGGTCDRKSRCIATIPAELDNALDAARLRIGYPQCIHRTDSKFAHVQLERERARACARERAGFRVEG